MFLAFIGAFIGNPFNISFDITRGYAWAWGLATLVSFLLERYYEPFQPDLSTPDEEEAGVIALKRFQKTLNIKVDGIFGDKTKKALEEWQVEKKLPVTSRFDKATRIAIAKSWEAEEEEEEKNK